MRNESELTCRAAATSQTLLTLLATVEYLLQPASLGVMLGQQPGQQGRPVQWLHPHILVHCHRLVLPDRGWV